MITKYLPSYGGDFDRIIFDEDESVWVPEAKLYDIKAENEKLREMIRMAKVCMSYPHCAEKCQYHYVKNGCWECEYQDLIDELGIEVE